MIIRESDKYLRKVRALDKKLKTAKGKLRKELLNEKSNAILQYIRVLKRCV